MSISKYHVSKNLFDATIEQGAINATTGLDTSNNERIRSSAINLMQGVYTINAIGDANDAFIYLYATNGDYIGVYQSSWARLPLTITLSTDCKVRFVFKKYSGTVTPSDITNIMLNTGSTALPYEPYGNTWQEVGYKKYETATDTITSLPKTIIGDGQPISAYTIKGNMSQSGTPTPSNPVYPTEVGEKTANLLDMSQSVYGEGLTSGIGATTPTFAPSASTSHSGMIKVKSNTEYTIKLSEAPTTARSIYMYDSLKAFVRVYPIQQSTISLTITTGATEEYIIFGYNINDTQAMLVEGETAPTSYIPWGYEIPILSNGNTYPVYLAEPIRNKGTAVDSMASTGTVTRSLKKWVFNGSENWTYDSNSMLISKNNLGDIPVPLAQSALVCSHFPNDNTGMVNGGSWLFRTMGYAQTGATDVTSWKQWVANQYANGTPLTVVYILETAETETFTAPSIPTSGSPQSFDVDTTLKPSEVSLTYHGWHEHSDEKYVGG